MERASLEPRPTDAARAAARQLRLESIRADLIPRIRGACPDLPDELFLELIEAMATTKLRDEELNR